LECPVEHVAGQEPVQAGVVLAQPHVVRAGRAVETGGVEPVRVDDVGVRGWVTVLDFVVAGGALLVPLAVRGVAVRRRCGTGGGVGEGFDVAVRVGAVERLRGRGAVDRGIDQRQVLAAGTVGIRLDVFQAPLLSFSSSIATWSARPTNV
jgi:hypothetical protein